MEIEENIARIDKLQERLSSLTQEQRLTSVALLAELYRRDLLHNLGDEYFAAWPLAEEALGLLWHLSGGGQVAEESIQKLVDRLEQRPSLPPSAPTHRGSANRVGRVLETFSELLVAGLTRSENLYSIYLAFAFGRAGIRAWLEEEIFGSPDDEKWLLEVIERARGWDGPRGRDVVESLPSLPRAEAGPDLLGALGTDSGNDEMADMLRTEEGKKRAILTIAGLQPRAAHRRAFAELMTLLDDPNREVRLLVIAAMGAWKGDAVCAVPDLLRHAADPSASEAVCKALERMGKKSAAKISAGFTDDNPAVRLVALRAYLKVAYRFRGPKFPPAKVMNKLDELARQDDELPVRRAASKAAESLRSRQSAVAVADPSPPELLYPEPPYEGDIREGIAELGLLDPEVADYAARLHRYELAPPVEEAVVSQFEKQHDVELPSEYRTFLLTIGSGGAGPGYGLEPFPNVELDIGSRRRLRFLRLAHLGCGLFDVLVLDKDEAGNMWADERVDGRGVGPYELEGESSRTGFDRWYRLWLAAALANARS